MLTFTTHNLSQNKQVCQFCTKHWNWKFEQSHQEWFMLYTKFNMKAPLFAFSIWLGYISINIRGAWYIFTHEVYKTVSGEFPFISTWFSTRVATNLQSANSGSGRQVSIIESWQKLGLLLFRGEAKDVSLSWGKTYIHHISILTSLRVDKV